MYKTSVTGIYVSYSDNVEMLNNTYYKPISAGFIDIKMGYSNNCEIAYKQ